MVRRYLKSLLLVLIFGGLAGPLFLLIYFVFETPFDRQSTGWMVFAGLLITVADALIALAVAGYSAQRTAKSAALERTGVLALAQITGMGETGTQINDQPLVKLDLHIAGPGFAFDTQKRVIASVTRMGNFSARKLVVLVDPATSDYEIDWERSALVNGLASARFTISEEGRTYDLSGQAEPLMEILQILKANNIPLGGPLDLRSNSPALRQQINEVVRRAAAAQPSPAFVARPGAVSDTPEWTQERPSAAQRLQELSSLRALEAISEEEYAEKRRRIIAEI
jgi:hypothetical protein